ncbi:hypothetical protein M569_09695 [Genlisea aurea]|uniref:Bifunctional inhibitor/plant lipid transfer protein/seed storage helical domain-containing protein n=1 Tax=Genlisea aurea TaxID=192259 RepID=S8CDY9_9LAMI|nr:hypothetical protein M569_09695 [Genlisea aurea]
MAALFFVVSLAALVFSDHHQAAPTAEPPSCETTLFNLVPCYAFVSGNSTAPPSPSCCSHLADVIGSQPICLCLMLNGTAASHGYVFDPNRALRLPGDCRLETPPATACNDSSADSPLGDQQQPNSPAGGSPNGNGVSNGVFRVVSRFAIVTVFFDFIATYSYFFSVI